MNNILNIVLLYSDISRGMKSYGPKAIVPMGSARMPLITKQINTIKKLYTHTNHKIYAVLGFEKEKIQDILCKYHQDTDVNIIHHTDYVKDNQGAGFIKAIEHIRGGGFLVIQNGVYANYKPNSLAHSTIPMLKHSVSSAFPIGIRTNNNLTQYLFYGLEYAWPEICYIAPNDYNKIRSILLNTVSAKKQRDGMFLFEYLNYLIDQQYPFYTETVNHKNIKKIINHKETC